MGPTKCGNKTTDPAFVVIAEDDSSLAELMACVVEQVGATPLSAYDGEQALRLVRSHTPSVVITDLRMPCMSGDALIAALREDRGVTPSIILVSAAPHAQLLRAGADAVLAKPFDLVDLHELLDHYLAVGPSHGPLAAKAVPPAEPWRQPGSRAGRPDRHGAEPVLLGDALDG